MMWCIPKDSAMFIQGHDCTLQGLFSRAMVTMLRRQAFLGSFFTFRGMSTHDHNRLGFPHCINTYAFKMTCITRFLRRLHLIHVRTVFTSMYTSIIAEFFCIVTLCTCKTCLENGQRCRIGLCVNGPPFKMR